MYVAAAASFLFLTHLCSHCVLKITQNVSYNVGMFSLWKSEETFRGNFQKTVISTTPLLGEQIREQK